MPDDPRKLKPMPIYWQRDTTDDSIYPVFECDCKEPPCDVCELQAWYARGKLRVTYFAIGAGFAIVVQFAVNTLAGW